MHQVGDLFELNVKLRCQKVNINNNININFNINNNININININIIRCLNIIIFNYSAVVGLCTMTCLTARDLSNWKFISVFGFTFLYRLSGATGNRKVLREPVELAD